MTEYTDIPPAPPPVDPAPEPTPDPAPTEPVKSDLFSRFEDSLKQPKETTAPSAAAEDPFFARFNSLVEQDVGRDKALLASSLNAGVREEPDKASRITVLADKLGLSAETVAANYDQLSRSVRLKSVDYSRLLSRHPEVAGFLSIPSNAALAQDDVPVLQSLDRSLKGDPTGVLPYGYNFQRDGSILGPISLDGTQRQHFDGLDDLRSMYDRQVAQAAYHRLDVDSDVQELQKRWFPSATAGFVQSVAGTLAAGRRAIGSPGADDLTRDAARLGEASEVVNPGLSGTIGRTIGQLVGDAPLYLLGGEVAGAADLVHSMRAVAAGAKALPAIPRSEYLIDAWKTALMYSPVAARGAVNEGAEKGTGFGIQNFLINSLVPGAFGSRFGVARALVPGQTALPSVPWMGVAGRLVTNAGAQAGIGATTELANALHEYASGDATALSQERLVPRLAQAGIMGGVLGGAFHLPHEVATLYRNRQVASHSALVEADSLGQQVDLIKASKLSERNPDRFNALIKSLIPDAGRVRYAQREDFEGMAESANMKPDDLAAQMHVEEQWRLAQTTDQAMTLPTADVLRVAAGLEDPKAVAGIVKGVRKEPTGLNVHEAVEFYKTAPKEVEDRVAAMRADITEAAKAVVESDPIYQDMHGKLIDAGETSLSADSNARLWAAFFNTKAARWNADGTREKMDPHAEYVRYSAQVQRELPGKSLKEPFDALLNKLRKGDVPTEGDVRGESLIPWLRRKGVKDPGGDIASMQLDRDIKDKSKPLVREGGTPLDLAAMRAYDEGFIADSDPNTLLDAISRESQGDASYREGQEHPELGPMREALAAIQEHLENKGLDIKTLSNEDIKAALAGNEAFVQRFGQPAEKSGEKNLVVMHNLSAENLLHADRMGGLAVPSLGVARTEHPFTGFGEITLLAKPGILEDRKAKTFDADVYSPRYPDIRYEVDKKSLDVVWKKLGRASTDLGHVLSGELDINDIKRDGVRAFENSKAAKLTFLREKGIDPELPKNKKSGRVESWEADNAIRKALDPVWEEFNTWAAKLFRTVVSGEKIGHETASGNMRYIPHTLDNAVKILTRALRDGEGFNYGIGNLRSTVAKQFKSVKAVQGDRNRIVTHGEMEKIKKEVNDEFFALANKLNDDPRWKDANKFGGMDRAIDILKDVAKKGERGLDEWLDNPTPELKAESVEFLSKLRELPTEYFETKVQRAVGIDEFAAALVPEGADPEVVAALQKHGVAVSTYKNGDEADRTRAISEAGSAANILFQPERGYIQFDATKHFLVTLTGKADLSTVAHESAHAFLEIMGDFAEREGAPAEFKDDYEKTLAFLGAKDRASLTEAHHEKWARAIEQYLMEGTSPSPELRDVFQRFALWLTHLYRSVKKLVTLTPEVKGVMDRLLATDDAIAKANADLGTSTIFPTREASGMTDKAWMSYLKDIKRSSDSANARVFREAMKTLRHENTKTYKRERAQAMADAKAIIDARPISKVEDAFIKGIDPDGKDLPAKPKLRTSDVEGFGAVSELPRGITAPDGIPMRMVADEFGFANATELWTALANLPKRKVEIATMAEHLLKAKFPELTPEVMLTEAMEAVHNNSAHGDVLSRESAALAIKAGRAVVPQDHIKQVARQIVDGTAWRDLRADVHLAAERKASRAATDALLKKEPDYAEALEAKQREELSHALYKATQDALEIVEKTNAIMIDAARVKTQAMLGKAPGQVWQVVTPDGLTMSFVTKADADAAAGEVAGATVAQGPGYQATMNRLREFWGRGADRPDLTYGEVHDFYREAQATLHQAKDAYSILVEDKRVEVEKLAATGMQVLKDNRKGAKPAERPVGFFATLGVGLRKFDAMMRNLAFVCRQFDGEKSGGFFFDHFDRPLTKAGVDEVEMNVADMKWWKEHADATLGRGIDFDRMMHIPGIDGYRSYGQRLAIALNSGSTKNLRRLMDGEGWTREQVKNITDTLSKSDWAFVRGVWDYLKTKKEPIFSLHQKLTGIAPEARDTISVETPFGTIDGGYFPIVYDPTLGAHANEISMERAHTPVTGTPRAGFTEKTVERTDLRLLLDSRALTGHLSAVAHYLSHAEVISNLNKLLNNKNLTDAMIKNYGMESFKVIRDTVQDAAQGMKGPQTFAETCVKFLRTRSGMAIMGANAMSAASQVFGATQAMERVGAGPYMSALGRIAKDAMSTESASVRVMELSKMMRYRGESQFLERLEQTNSSHLTSVPGWMREHAYWLMNKSQWMVDLPTWIAEFENAQAAGHDQAKAVALADSAVIDTQGSGFLKDLSKIQRANEFGKLFMQFGGFFNKTYQLMRSSVNANATLTKVGPISVPLPDSPAAIARLAGSFALLVSLPAVGMSLFKEAVRPSSDNDGTAEFWAKHLAKDNLSYLLNTMVLGRELTGALSGFDYSGPAGLRSFSLTTQLFKQIGQGEFDAGLVRSAGLTVGSFWGMPAVQLDRIIRGMIYMNEHGSVNPLPAIVGPPGR